MRLLAASFMSEDAAVLALDMLNTRALVRNGIQIAPLGRACDPSGPSTVMAGVFAEDVVEAVRLVIEQLGGTVIVEKTEQPLGNG